MSDSYFQGKTAVVTGAAGTLCSTIAIDLARLGMKVALVGRTRASLEAVEAAIRKEGGTALAVPADVTDTAAVEAACRTITAAVGPCDYLINGAGGNHPQAVTTINEFSASELDASAEAAQRGFFNLDLQRFIGVLQTNTLGTVIPCQAFGRDMARRGSGAIINFASMNTYRPLTRNAAYAMSKAAVANFTMWLAAYLAPAGIRVNAIAPGFFVNERSRKILMTEDGGLTARGQNVMHHTPMRRFGEARELTGTVRWLLDERAAGFVTGITVPVDGGFLATSGV